MKMVVMAVFDVQAQMFQRPFFVTTQGVGMRMVADEVNRGQQDNMLWLHPEDFRLFVLGSFDDNSGLFQADGLPDLVCDCSSFKASS